MTYYQEQPIFKAQRKEMYLRGEMNMVQQGEPRNYIVVVSRIVILRFYPIMKDVEQGSPTPGPWTGTGPWRVRNRATQQEVSGR